MKSESWKTLLERWLFNFFPAFRGTGGRVTFISSDYKEMRVKLPLNWRTRNYVGTVFGGSLYGSVDPMYMLMLMKILGPTYTVWDKAATIYFKKPGRSTLFATFKISDEEINTIHELLKNQHSIDRNYQVDLTDEEGTVHATIEKTIYISKKTASVNYTLQK